MSEVEYKRKLEDAVRRSTAGESYQAAEKALAGPKYKVPLEAIKLAHSFRQKVKEHDNSPYLVIILVAIIIDFADATWFIGLFMKPLLFYFLWGRGTMKVKIAIRSMLFFDMIPPISSLPLSTIAVRYAYNRSRKEAGKAKEELKKANQSAYA